MARTSASNRIQRVPIGKNSLYCKGSTYVTSGSNLGISGSSPFTIAAWGYVNAASGTQTIMSIGNAAGTNTGIILRSNANAWHVSIQGTGVVPVTAPLIQPNTFYEVFVSYAGGSAPILIGVNGKVLNGSGSLTMNLTNAPVIIGRDYSGSSALTGGVSDVRVWNVALTVNQLAAMYATRVVPTSGLVRRYCLTEGTGTSAIDISSNNDTGTITNPFWSFNNVPYGLPIKPIAKPSDLPSCIFYYEADQGVTLDGSNKVSQWDDLSGNGAHMTQGTAGLRFGYTASNINGLPTVNMVDGTSNIMTASINFPVTQPHTLMVFAKSNATQPTAFSGILALGSGGSGGQTSSIGTDNTRKLWFGGAGYGTPTFFVPTTGSSYFLVKSTDIRTDTVTINGVGYGTSKQLSSYGISPLNLAVLGQYSSGSSSGNWEVALIAGFTKEILNTEINAVANYINQKYAAGLTAGTRTATTGRIATG